MPASDGTERVDRGAGRDGARVGGRDGNGANEGGASLGSEDLRAAVSAGLLSEAQAAGLIILAERRAGYRDRMGPDDEPFELFRGLNEIFVATGLVLLILGGTTLAWGVGAPLAPALAGLGISWALAEYFTRVRRMILPSLVLAVSVVLFATTGAVSALIGELGAADAVTATRAPITQVSGIGALAALLFFARFRLPFALFLAGLLAIPPVFVGTGAIGGLVDFAQLLEDPTRAFDLAGAGRLALTTLGFGLACLTIALAFDMSDPHRVSRRHRCGFWLHLLAAPAIVNTLALTLWQAGTPAALTALTAIIVLVVLVALVIDRRSFLLSAAAYIGLLLGAAADRSAIGVGPAATFLLLGAAITLLGAAWTGARARLMRALPEFPGKAYLPPYARQFSETP
ncbi:MAG: hypothetical protein ACFBRM_11450 [Pikeienuella sp.]